jgi:hypothetical protein
MREEPMSYRIFTYHCVDPDVPENHRWTARMQMLIRGIWEWSPVFHHAASEEQVREGMRIFHERELAKYARKEEHYGKLAKARKVKAETDERIQKLSPEEFARLKAEAEARAAAPKPPTGPPPSLKPKAPPSLKPPTPSLAPPKAPSAPSLKPPPPRGLVPPKKS